MNGVALGWKNVLTNLVIVGQVCNWKCRNLEVIRMVCSFTYMKNVVLVAHGRFSFLSHHVNL